MSDLILYLFVCDLHFISHSSSSLTHTDWLHFSFLFSKSLFALTYWLSSCFIQIIIFFIVVVMFLNFFFISFKNLLEEIFYQSTVNNEKCYKVENILNFLLFRMNLPTFETTQLSWTLNDKVYSFTKNVLKSEISYKLLFKYINYYYTQKNNIKYIYEDKKRK